MTEEIQIIDCEAQQPCKFFTLIPIFNISGLTYLKNRDIRRILSRGKQRKEYIRK
jgi:hypothetical protein